MGMEKKKETTPKGENTNRYISKVFRDFAKVRPVVRSLCLRGCNTREEYKKLSVAKGGYDSILAEIKFALQESGVIKERKGEKGKIYYFHNQPLQKQNNPLAEIWRFAKPNRKAILFYLTILDLAQREYEGVTKASLVEEISSIGTEEQAYEAFKEEFVRSSVERALKEMQQLMLIREVSAEEERVRRFKVESDIWQGFQEEELEEIYIYLEFLKNVVPFELPYYFLQKHLELYLHCYGKTGILASIKPMFLFRHRNPVNVLESEMMYYFLRHAKHGIDGGKDVIYQMKMRDYEMNTPNKWENGLPPIWFSDECGQVEGLEYDCFLNAIYMKGRMYRNEYNGDGTWKKGLPEESRRYNFVGADLFVANEDDEDKEELKKKKAEYAKLQEEVRPLFHEMNGIYFEKIFKLWNENEAYTKQQLRRNLFANEEIDEIESENLSYADSLLEEMLMPNEEAYQLFIYDEQTKTYSINGNEIKFLTATRIQREALQSLEEFTFTKFFLSDKTIQKIKKNTKGLISEWSIRDIDVVNQEHRQSPELLSYQKMQSLLKVMKCNGMLTDKAGKRYIPLRLQYSLRYDEYRLLVVNEEQTDCQMLALEEVDFTKVSLKAVMAWEEKEQWMQKAVEKQRTKTFRMKNNWDSAYWDTARSDEVMLLLSSYDKIVDYIVEDPDKESGQYIIKVKYWPEDEKDLLEDFKRIMTDKNNIMWEIE